MAKKVPARAILPHLFVADEEDDELNVYAVIDGANCDVLLDKLDEFQPEHACLYSGDLEPDMAEVAPYLVRLDAAHPFTRWLLESGWRCSWGVFAVSKADLRTLRRHFRTFLMVYDPDGKPMYFRWYDPRVLRVYLPTCNAEETKAVFGPVQSYVMEDQDRFVLLRFRPHGATPREESMILVGE